MTSSLVGSEMCIRDSRMDTQGLEIAAIKNTLSSLLDDRKRDVDNGESAVSYTHLTLPTICSV
eukprot:9101598-Prorocentrum_lima.AAC.1